jgi:acyl carrier protein
MINNMDNYIENLKSIIAKELNCQVENITDNAGWNKFNNWDSLAHIGIISAVEQQFSVRIENNQIMELKDFDSILQYIIKEKIEL